MAMVASIYGQTAFENEDTQKADTLKSLGLFIGTGAGYEFQKQVTRAEAAAMLVRLLGMEKEAQNGNYSPPPLHRCTRLGRQIHCLYVQ